MTLQEARWRSAISRCYYAIFGVAGNFLVAKGVAIPRIDTHKFVRDTFSQSNNKLERKIGKDLRNLWHDRKEADYDEGADFDVKRVAVAYQLAVRTLNRMASINKTP